MSRWNAKYRNDFGEYEITFYSKDYEKTKAVEKVCCAIMDGIVKSSADVEPVRHGRWVKDSDFLICLNCESEIDIKNSLGVENHKNYCSNCGAKMDLEEV